MAKILVTGVRMWYGFNTIRILSNQGHEVYAAESSRLSMGLYSKYIKKRYFYPDISADSKGFIDKIIEIVEENEIDYLIPVFEETYVLSYYKEALKDKVKILVPDFKSINKLHDKYSLSELAKELEIPSPKTCLLENFTPNELNFPIVLKPRRERGAVGIKIIKNNEEFEKFTEKIDKKEYMAQELMSQEQYCTIGLAKDGKLISNTIYHNLEEYPYKGGFGILRESVASEEINKYVEKIVERENYSGFLCIDFLRDLKSSSFKITDVNPRMSPGLMIAYSEGISLPNLYLDLLENKEHKKIFSKGGKGTYTTVLRLGWLFQVLFSGNFKLLKGFKRRTINKLEDVWDWKDLKPSIVFFTHLLISVVFGPKMSGSQQSFYYKRSMFFYDHFNCNL